MAPEETRITCCPRLRSLRRSSTNVSSHARLRRPVSWSTSSADPTFTTTRRAVASGETGLERRVTMGTTIKPTGFTGTMARALPTLVQIVGFDEFLQGDGRDEAEIRH